jgi:hypothetical protein
VYRGLRQFFESEDKRWENWWERQERLENGEEGILMDPNWDEDEVDPSRKWESWHEWEDEEEESDIEIDGNGNAHQLELAENVIAENIKPNIFEKDHAGISISKQSTATGLSEAASSSSSKSSFCDSQQIIATPTRDGKQLPASAHSSAGKLSYNLKSSSNQQCIPRFAALFRLVEQLQKKCCTNPRLPKEEENILRAQAHRKAAIMLNLGDVGGRNHNGDGDNDWDEDGEGNEWDENGWNETDMHGNPIYGDRYSAEHIDRYSTCTTPSDSRNLTNAHHWASGLFGAILAYHSRFSKFVCDDFEALLGSILTENADLIPFAYLKTILLLCNLRQSVHVVTDVSGTLSTAEFSQMKDVISFLVPVYGSQLGELFRESTKLLEKKAVIEESIRNKIDEVRTLPEADEEFQNEDQIGAGKQRERAIMYLQGKRRRIEQTLEFKEGLVEGMLSALVYLCNYHEANSLKLAGERGNNWKCYMKLITVQYQTREETSISSFNLNIGDNFIVLRI